ncbi:hypothetical protein GUITHDRAFT_155606 [Guillardia theta CCMP2712]|uniref:Ribosome associated membrane protein RAMP4 n=1 Tax=Guillardia theta (strain CCMP2712) TaxID=905079 RepID=L1IFX3_GUITC|nr:hypothetical protein GUITHDRAFT_155606 [Guillardia theta CCMP2712]EKX34982.1 hypothetical protein GUITHDRAFT_155606 [Guillardia theta CCMP2712]|eukprot:XP_005821962.1 hypothetical protein GUITHDRAFT_155606 [Guillardia theta CCMP2712]
MSGSRKGSLKQKSERFDSNINKRGNVKLSSKKEKQFTVGPIVLAFFLFVVVGSSLLQIIRQAQSGQMEG